MKPNFFRKELSNYRETFDLSPEKLKARYKDLENSIENKKIEKNHLKAQRSLSPGNLNKDLDYSIVKNELWKYNNDYKNQVDYLKLIVLSMDNKLKVFIFINLNNIL